jgi:hypothetical protein
LGELPPYDEVRLEPDPWWPGARFRRWRDRRTWQLAGAAYRLADGTVRWETSPPGARSWLVEAGTGAPVLDLTGWSIAGMYGEGPATPAPILMAEEGRVIWIGRLRPDLSGVDVLGAIDIGARDENSYPPRCGVQGDHAVCRFDPDGRRAPDKD